jgi:serine/threonine-protein kinase
LSHALERTDIRWTLPRAWGYARLGNDVGPVTMRGGTDNSLSVGDVIDGKFRVQRVLGSGGGGVVVCATHLHLDQLVAVKVMRSESADNPTLVSRFLREARAASRLKGTHVARVTDVGMPHHGTPYIVMEYLEGEELGAALRKRGPLPVGEAVLYVAQACDAVAEAHALGIVHRDIKPSNLFVTRRADGKPCIKILDFGISKTVQLARVDDELTSAEAVLGTPHYMAPEQLRASRNADQRSDIWALGVVLFTLLTGRRPFRGETMAEIAAATLRDPMPSVREARPDVPPELERVIARCLEKEPERRYQRVEELASALAPFAAASFDDAPVSLEALAPTSTEAWAHGRLEPSQPSMPSMPEISGALVGQELLAPRTGATLSTWSSSRLGRAFRGASARRLVPGLIIGACLVVATGALIGAIASSEPAADVSEPAVSAEERAPASQPSDESSDETASEGNDEAHSEDAAPVASAPVAPSSSSAAPEHAAPPPVEPPEPPPSGATKPPRDFGGRQ